MKWCVRYKEKLNCKKEKTSVWTCVENDGHSFILTWCWWCSWCLFLPHTALDWCTHVALALRWAAAGPKEQAHTHIHKKTTTIYSCPPFRLYQKWTSLTYSFFCNNNLNTFVSYRPIVCYLNSIAVISLVSLTYLESSSCSLQWWLVRVWACDCRVGSYLCLSMHREQVR